MEWKIIVIGLVLLSIPLGLSYDEETNCKKTYFYIIDNNWKFNETELQEFGNTLNLTDMEEYLDKYVYNCELKKYSDKLPQKPQPQEVVICRNCNDEICSTDLNSFIKISIPFFDMYLGDMDCKNVRFWNYFFELENTNSYTLKGIRIWWILVGITLVLLISLKKSDSKLNKTIERFKTIR